MQKYFGLRQRCILRFGCGLAAFAVSLLTTGCVHLGSTSIAASVETVDPPERVARLSFVQGSASFQPAGSGNLSSAELNRPLTSGDQLWVPRGSRAELDLGFASVRLDSDTMLDILDLGDEATQLKVTDGALNIHLRRLDEHNTFEIDTPHAAITLSRTGEYRVDVDADQDTARVVVQTGDAEVSGVSQSFTVQARQQANIQGTESTIYNITSAPNPDSFDQFCAARDGKFEHVETATYVSPEVIGYQDLDEFGVWHVDATWGPVWAPRSVAAGWAPYRFGHWVWIEPWGWTWIDDTPWGFAPFHYGRWVFIGPGWCWVPGPLHIRPVYAPALVMFVGGGRPGFDFFFWVGGGAGIAWFPLGPREVYIPPYHASPRYITNINVSNTIIVNRSEIQRVDVRRQRYVNQNINGALTAVPRDAFIGGRPISRAAVPISRQQAAEARIAGTAAPVAPTRESLGPPGRGGAATPGPPQAQRDRTVVVRRSPAPAPVPFEQKRPALDARPGKPPDRGTLDQLRRTQPQPQPQVRQGRPGTIQGPQVQRPQTPQPNNSDVRREQKNDANRTRAIQNERRREQQNTRTPTRPQTKKE
jgi:hypothetical protein